MNRMSENLLPTAEEFSALAQPFGFSYPRTAFVNAWHNTNFNEFHDILCGSAIHDSYIFSTDLFKAAYATGQSALQGSIKKISDNIDTSGKGIPIVVFNPLSWDRTDTVQMKVPAGFTGSSPVVKDANGHRMPAQIADSQLVFTAKNVPSLGYKVFYITDGGGIAAGQVRVTQNTLENEFFTVKVDPTSGAISSIYDKKAHREVLAQNRSGSSCKFSSKNRRVCPPGKSGRYVEQRI